MAIKYKGTFTSNGDGTGTWRTNDGQYGIFDTIVLGNIGQEFTYKQQLTKSDGTLFAEVQGVVVNEKYVTETQGKYSGEFFVTKSNGKYEYKNLSSGKLTSTGSFTPLDTGSPLSPLAGTAKKADVFALTGTPEFGADTADRITNFNPKEKDRLQIDVSDFGSNAEGTFKIANNSKALTKALASTTDFIYLKSTGELYYNENGKLPGYGDGGIFAILENKANITTKNVEFL